MAAAANFVGGVYREAFQVNGQRIIGPPVHMHMMEPPKGSEVFVGNLPRDIAITELLHVMESAGRVYELRLMVDFSGSNRGFAFVKYYTPEEATNSLKTLNYFTLRVGKNMYVERSVDNCRLYLGGVPKHLTEQELTELLSRFVIGVKQVFLMLSLDGSTVNRGFAFIDFDNHRMASIARRTLADPRLDLGNYRIFIDWAEPEPVYDGEVFNTVRNLFVGKLKHSTTEETLWRLFSTVPIRGRITRLRKIDNYAFVHFSDRDSADRCKKALRNVMIDGVKIFIGWARPVDRPNGDEAEPDSNNCQESDSQELMPVSSQEMPPQQQMVGLHAALPVVAGFEIINLEACVPLIVILQDLCLIRGWGLPQYQFRKLYDGSLEGYGCTLRIFEYIGGQIMLTCDQYGTSLLHAHIRAVGTMLVYLGESKVINIYNI